MYFLMRPLKSIMKFWIQWLVQSGYMCNQQDSALSYESWLVTNSTEHNLSWKDKSYSKDLYASIFTKNSWTLFMVEQTFFENQIQLLHIIMHILYIRKVFFHENLDSTMRSTSSLQHSYVWATSVWAHLLAQN